MILRILIPILILAVGYGSYRWLGRKEEPPAFQVREQQKLKTEYQELARTHFPVVLESQGAIRAHHNTVLTPLVGGTVISIHPAFEDGAFFEEGEILMELDPSDLEAARVGADSRLARAEALLAQEEARAKQARLNWDDMGYTEEPSPLVLREPQLKEANANVVAAQAELEQAIRNVERAKIRAPFDGRVRSRDVGLGQAVSATTALGEIYATDFAEVRLPLTPLQMEFVDLPSRDGDAPVEVTLTDALGDPTRPGRATWRAQIVRTEGALDDTSRELFAIARIEDPFGLESGEPELRIGQPVRAAIEGRVLEDVFVIPRSSLRGLNRVYLIDREGPTGPAIQRLDVEPVWSTSEVLVVRDGITPGDWLATSRLPFAPNGAPVELVDNLPAAEAAEAAAPLGAAVSGS